MRMRELIESPPGDIMAGLTIVALDDPDVSATALVYQSWQNLQRLEDAAADGSPHAIPTRKERCAEIEMLKGLYETMLDRCADTYVATQECTCAMCKADAAPMN